MRSYGDVVLKCATCGTQGKCLMREYLEGWPLLCDVDGVGVMCESCRREFLESCASCGEEPKTIRSIRIFYPCRARDPEDKNNAPCWSNGLCPVVKERHVWEEWFPPQEGEDSAQRAAEFVARLPMSRSHRCEKCKTPYNPDNGAIVCILFEGEGQMSKWLVVRTKLANKAVEEWVKGEGSDIAPQVAGLTNGWPTISKLPSSIVNMPLTHPKSLGPVLDIYFPQAIGHYGSYKLKGVNLSDLPMYDCCTFFDILQQGKAHGVSGKVVWVSYVHRPKMTSMTDGDLDFHFPTDTLSPYKEDAPTAEPQGLWRCPKCMLIIMDSSPLRGQNGKNSCYQCGDKMLRTTGEP